MEKGAHPRLGWQELLWKEASNAPCQILDTKAGSLFLQDHCPAVVVERWSAESGLHAFARPRADAARAFGEPAHAVSRRVSHAAHSGSPSHRFVPYYFPVRACLRFSSRAARFP